MKFPAPVIDVAIEPKTKADQDKLAIALAEAVRGRPDVPRPHGRRRRGRRSSPAWASCTSRSSSTACSASSRSTPTSAARRSRIAKRFAGAWRRSRASSSGRSGGRGQYGHVVINMEPAQAGTGFVFEDKIVGGVIPREYIGPVERGIKEALENGVLAGYPMVDVKVELIYGSYHDVDSSEMAFKIAGSMAYKEAAKQRASGAARADHERRGRVSQRLHGRHSGRPVGAARQDRRHDAARRSAGDRGDACRCRRCSATPPSCGRSHRDAPCTRWSSATTRKCRRARRKRSFNK